jgi:hypothetical protein
MTYEPDGQSLHASLSTTAPVINAVLAELQNLPAGLYRVRCDIVLTGTAEPQTRNAELRTGGSGGLVRARVLTLPVRDAVDLAVIDHDGGHLGIYAVAAGTAGAIYNAQLTVTPLN